MSQTSYAFEPAQAFAGALVNADDPHKAESAIALEDCGFGLAAMRCDDADKPNTVRIPRRNQSTIALDGALVASNVFNGTINGVALSATTYATSSAATLAVIAGKIDALLLTLGIISVTTVSGNSLIIDAEDASVLAASVVITAGSSQATATITNYTSDTLTQFLGVLRHSQQPPRRSDGLPGYAEQDQVAVVRQGMIWVPISSDVADGAAVYIDYTSGNEGKFTDVTTAPNLLVSGAKFRGAWTTAGLGLAQVELNIP